MNAKVTICMLLLVAAAVLCMPAAAADSGLIVPGPSNNNSDPPILLTDDNHYGYLQVESVKFTMNNRDADVVVTYTIEPWLAFLVSFFGKDDLKTRVLGMLQYPESGYNQEVTFKYIDTGSAVLHITNAALDNMDNSYWFRAHTFGCTIPQLTFVFSDSDIKRFTNVKEMSKGIGYFKS